MLEDPGRTAVTPTEKKWLMLGVSDLRWTWQKNIPGSWRCGATPATRLLAHSYKQLQLLLQLRPSMSPALKRSGELSPTSWQSCQHGAHQVSTNVTHFTSTDLLHFHFPPIPNIMRVQLLMVDSFNLITAGISSRFTSSHSPLRLRESGLAHYSDIPTASCSRLVSQVKWVHRSRMSLVRSQPTSVTSTHLVWNLNIMRVHVSMDHGRTWTWNMILINLTNNLVKLQDLKPIEKRGRILYNTKQIWQRVRVRAWVQGQALSLYTIYTIQGQPISTKSCQVTYPGCPIQTCWPQLVVQGNQEIFMNRIPKGQQNQEVARAPKNKQACLLWHHMTSWHLWCHNVTTFTTKVQ